MTDDFYIGWQERAAPDLGRFLRSRVALVAALVLVAAGTFAAIQPEFAKATFEYGTVRTFEGRVALEPYPVLVVDRPGGGQSSWLLTVFGKEGAESEVGHLDGHRVRLDGTLVHRDRMTMVEIAANSITDLGHAGAVSGPDPSPGPLDVVLRGEIVDSKCFLGVMKPGNLKTHRACAALCIRGGVPPVLLVRDDDGNASYYLIVDRGGRAANDRVLEYVAEPVEVTGRIAVKGSLTFLYADLTKIRRV